jgi:tRNA dimethylallyltransferase
MKQPLLLLAGPTASGKSEIALLVAEALGGEIVSVDSMQVYRGLDIGTAKPSLAEQARVPHHLIDLLDLHESFDAARFVTLARAAVAAIRARGRVPILCGGTGLYFKVFLHGLGKACAANPQLRAQLEQTPLPVLLAELAEKDPAAHARIDKNNPRRVIRALEVIRTTGKPFSQHQGGWATSVNDNTAPPEKGLAIGIVRSREDLQLRIGARVDEMFRRGLVEETRELLARGLAQNRTAMQALGYRQVVEFLADVRPLAETIELVKVRTRQYARRQLTWFRRQLALDWIEAQPADSPRKIAGDILEAYSKSRR